MTGVRDLKGGVSTLHERMDRFMEGDKLTGDDHLPDRNTRRATVDYDPACSTCSMEPLGFYQWTWVVCFLGPWGDRGTNTRKLSFLPSDNSRRRESHV
jgi:hypothetical protein